MTDQLRANIDGAPTNPAESEQDAKEYIRDGQQLLSIIERSNYSPRETSLFTTDELEQQAGLLSIRQAELLRHPIIIPCVAKVKYLPA